MTFKNEYTTISLKALDTAGKEKDKRVVSEDAYLQAEVLESLNQEIISLRVTLKRING